MAIKISGTIVIDDSRNIVNAGIVTASNFVGDGSSLTGVGVGTTGSINTSGIVTASIISANQFIGSGDNLVFSPTATSFNPSQGATGIGINTSISITFDQPIYAGVGTITLRNSSGIGTIIQSIGISSASVSISNQTLTITPAQLPLITNVYVVLPQGVVKNAVGGNIATVSTYNFTTFNFELLSTDPANASTNIGLTTNITLTFNSAPSRGTGTVSLRSGSAGGTTIETFDAAASARIAVSGNNWILDPTSNLVINTTYYPVVPNAAIQNYAGLNTTGGTNYSFTTRDLAPGDSTGGGILICQAGGTRWIVATSASEVSRNWYSRGDANTVAQQVSGCTGWFVPSETQFQNPGYTCRTFWDSYQSNTPGYWTDTQSTQGATIARYILMNNGNLYHQFKNCSKFVRSFRCVAY